MGKRLASVAAGIMAAALIAASCTGFAPPAYAYENATFSIAGKNNSNATYRVYKVFSADVANNAGADPDFPANDYPVIEWPGIASHISWNDAAKTATLAFLNTQGYGSWITEQYGFSQGSDEFAFQHDAPQNAAEFIAQKIGASENDADAATVPPTKAARSFALELARALAAAHVSSESMSATDDGSGTYIATFTGEQGYYLFITDDGSLSATESGDEAGTSPIWVPLGGTTTRIDEKTAVPTLKKEVREDATEEYGIIADASNGQDLSYRLTTEMPDNIKAFDTYFLKFTDTLPTGMKLSGDNTSSVRVTLAYTRNGNNYTTDITAADQVSIGYSNGNELVIAISDLKAAHPELDKSTKVIVDYQAHLTSEASIGSGGNLNSAVLTYAANPVTCTAGRGSWNDPDPEGTTSTLEGAHRTRTCTWQIDLNKKDKQTGTALSGAKYTLQASSPQTIDGITGPTDSPSIGKYLQADGSLGDRAYEFTTNDSGQFTVPRIDSGTYTIRETKAPSGYETQDADIVLVIATTTNGTTGEVEGWQIRTQGGEGVKVHTSDIVTGIDETVTDLASGVVSITTSDDKKVVLPITGLEGTAAVVGFASFVFAVSLLGLYRSRRDDVEQDA
ncbi:MAG: isopeptide-forming domain-containing fimbrial protein [Coriobacteriia bacterium]|nr:isopeptide-forming domain-containing fimbrial protein [Coriobacteriia bacterium]